MDNALYEAMKADAEADRKAAAPFEGDTSDAEERSVGTPRTERALGIIQKQLTEGEGTAETGSPGKGIGPHNAEIVPASDPLGFPAENAVLDTAAGSKKAPAPAKA